LSEELVALIFSVALVFSINGLNFNLKKVLQRRWPNLSPLQVSGVYFRNFTLLPTTAAEIAKTQRREGISFGGLPPPDAAIVHHNSAIRVELAKIGLNR
jgi:hypothetical protein